MQSVNYFMLQCIVINSTSVISNIIYNGMSMYYGTLKLHQITEIIDSGSIMHAIPISGPSRNTFFSM